MSASVPAALVTQTTWPPYKLPVEVFEHIAGYCSRADVQCLRLVCKEFDCMLSGCYFRNVVVNFSPENAAMLHEIERNARQTSHVSVARDGPECIGAPESVYTSGGMSVSNCVDHSQPRALSQSGADSQSSTLSQSVVLSQGLRALKAFGPRHIKRFALALEMDESMLIHPPPLVTQEIRRADWGLYRWPLEEPHYPVISILEKAADETEAMTEMMAELGAVCELGLSIDSGLGYLHAPPEAEAGEAQGSAHRPLIFRSPQRGRDPTGSISGDATYAIKSPEVRELRQMCLRFGCAVENWHTTALELLCQGTPNRYTAVASSEKNSRQAYGDDETPQEDSVALIERILQWTKASTDSPTLESPTDADSPMTDATWDEDLDRRPAPRQAEDGKLHPRCLSAAQAQLLLEMKWAHESLLHSFTTSVIRNMDRYQNLRSLKIARISTCHLTYLINSQIWESMMKIECLHLGVIPDWRDVWKETDPETVVDASLLPGDACEMVFELLEIIGRVDNIKKLHFEWVRGGRYEDGICQRDRNILPAPIVSRPRETLLRQVAQLEVKDILQLPYLHTLSFKNCWFAPHVFLNMVKHWSRQELKDLHLESVYLSGPPSAEFLLPIFAGNTPPAAQQSKMMPWPLCEGVTGPDDFFVTRAMRDGRMIAFALPDPPLPVFSEKHPVAVPRPPPNTIDRIRMPPPWHERHDVRIYPCGGTLDPEYNKPRPETVPGDAHIYHFVPPFPLDRGRRRPTNLVHYPENWHAFSWRHVLASLANNPEKLALTTRTVSNEQAMSHLRQAFESQYRINSSPCTSSNQPKKHRLRSITLKSCGYVLVDTPHLNNWVLTPQEIEPAQYSSKYIETLKQSMESAMFSSDGLLATVIPHVSVQESSALWRAWGIRFGWKGCFEDAEEKIKECERVGVPEPGRGRFWGTVRLDGGS